MFFPQIYISNITEVIHVLSTDGVSSALLVIIHRSDEEMEVEPKSEQKMNILVVMQRESSHSTVRTIITSPSEKWNCNRSALWEKKKDYIDESNHDVTASVS